MLEQLEHFLVHTIKIPTAEISCFTDLLRVEQYTKQEFFLREGQIPTKIGVVVKGLFRYLYINEQGDEFTKSFLPEGNFLTSYSAMIQNQPSAYAIEALEEATVLVITYADWQKLLAHHPIWYQLLLFLLEKGFIKKESRERAFLLDDAETRYLTFLEEYPGLENRVAQRIIASYIGIQPESLSRIRKTIRR
jgi:CRP-like cAMP-binding protein